MSLATWALDKLRHADDPISTRLRRVATSAPAIYGAYAIYGRLRPSLLERATGPEAREALPGDGLVDRPELDKTFTLDIAAPEAAVWPFLIQMGYGRAGWYTWWPFDNGGNDSADGVVPELQRLDVGDVLPDGPDAARGLGFWRVVELTPPTCMVLFSRRAATSGREIPDGEAIDGPAYECSWAFHLRPTSTGCRLVVRVRAQALGFTAGRLARIARRVIDDGDTVMEWTMMNGIKARAERVHRPRERDLHPVLDGLRGAAIIAFDFATPFARRARSLWGIDAAEAARPHPGDELVPEPRWGWTHAIEIDAPAEEVWPWVAQVGADRGGFYSYEWLENIAGCGLRNAETIHPEWEVSLGDGILLHPRIPRLEVVRVEPGCYFVAHIPADAAAVAAGKPWGTVSWLFLVEALGARQCRFVSRYRVACSDDVASRIAFGPPVIEPISFAMDRRMLQGVKERAERH